MYNNSFEVIGQYFNFRKSSIFNTRLLFMKFDFLTKFCPTILMLVVVIGTLFLGYKYVEKTETCSLTIKSKILYLQTHTKECQK